MKGTAMARKTRVCGTPATSKETLLAPIRRWYQLELERLAKQLRPRFEAGELYAWRDWSTPAEERIAAGPGLELSRRIAAHFGLEERRTEGWIDSDYETAHLILAVSPYSDAADGQTAECAVQHASDAVFWDVIVMARERGWYTPTDDESGPPARTPAEAKAENEALTAVLS